MDKTKVESLDCYPAVAMALGKAKASIELFKVFNNPNRTEWETDKQNSKLISCAFDWSGTPQGYDFWRNVTRKFNASNTFAKAVDTTKLIFNRSKSCVSNILIEKGTYEGVKTTKITG